MSNPLDLYTLGLLALFGSLGLGGALGALVGRWSRFEWGMAVGLMCLAAGGLGAAARLAWFVSYESAVLVLPPARCEQQQVGEGERGWVHIEHFEQVLSNGRVLRLRKPVDTGRCKVENPDAQDDRPALPAPAQRLRYSIKDASMTSDQPTLAALETDPSQPWAMVGVFSAFGGFGLLAGLFFWAHGRAEIRRARGLQRAPAQVVPWRRRMGAGLITAGNITLFAGAGFAAFGDMSVERSTFVIFGGAALACAEFMAAAALWRRLTAEVALILLIVGGGCAAAAWAMGVLA